MEFMVRVLNAVFWVAAPLFVASLFLSDITAGLIGDKVDQATLGLVTSAVARRWTVTRDLADTIEHLGLVSVGRSAGGDSGRLADELFALGQAVTTNPDLRDALSDPARSQDDKATLVRSLLEGKALPATVTLAVQSLEGSFRTVNAALTEYQQVAAEVHGERVATVRVAHPLGDAERRRLTDALSRQYDREIHLNVVVDPEVIGGIRVEIGDDVIDGTVSSRLDDARRKLAG
jgi:F-type H+-transporting ATPase subunit delta